MGRPSAKATVTLRFSPDVLEAVRDFQRLYGSDLSLEAVCTELVILGLARNAEAGATEAARIREVRRFRKWLYSRLGEKLSEIGTEVRQSVAELSSVEDASESENSTDPEHLPENT